MKFTPDALLQDLGGLLAARSRSPRRYWVAFSGGLDSTVLLHTLVQRREFLAAPLCAVHVNHNLNPDSSRWAEHCAGQCLALDVPFERFDIEVTAAPGISVEAVARELRYDAFHELLGEEEVLLAAQHRDDQLETFLLQALRGAGPHGLAAMPAVSRLGRGHLLRPLLAWPRAALADWAQGQGLSWIDDPSNADDRFDRNYLRNRVLPALTARWPSAAQTVSRSARHCAEAAALIDAMAATDLEQCGRDAGVLAVADLGRLDVVRQRNVLRHWLDWLGFPRPSEKKLEHILTDVMAAGPDAEPCVEWADVAVHRYRGGLYAERAGTPPTAGPWTGEEFALGPGLGSLGRQPGEAVGLPDGEVSVVFRQGGERLKPLGRAHHHELKKLFQEAAVLPWRRGIVPLVLVDGQLAAVGDLWVNADVAVPGGWRVEWRKKPRITAT